MSTNRDIEFFISYTESLEKENKELKDKIKQLQNLIERLQNDVAFLSK